MSNPIITLTPKWSDEMTALLDELRVIVESCPDAAEEVSRFGFEGSDLFQTHSESGSAGRASQFVLLLEPADRFRDLVSALRAFKVSGSVVERNGHGNPLSSGFVGCGDHDSTAERDSRLNPKESA
ncbi:hypothetical protein [Burkholderia gladioli]|uniref:hypothetical protein n=1 Tax=Burkholderia gladioli TaxID=28095 RepID=UPI00163FC12D|nr:hypothetical protein [Burkholderia gladioli]